MESNQAISEESKEISQILKFLPPVVLSKELHLLIQTVKEMQLVTTYEEVLEGLGKYIANKNLYDHHNNKVCCKGDDLGSVLGTDEFMISDLNTLLPKLVVPVNKTYKDSAEGSSQQSGNPLKRKLDGNVECDQRKMQATNASSSLSPMLLEIPSSPSYCDVSDSIDSLQGYDTAYVKDTSDEFLSAENGEEKIVAIEETFNIEYEVDSDSSNSTLTEISSDSDTEEISKNLEDAIFKFISKVVYQPKPESDIEFFADESSDDDEQSDAEISESDFWSCPKCNIKNKPTVRYCFKCFQQRCNWLPEKPSHMRRKHKKSRGLYKDTSQVSEASFSKCDQDFRGNSSSTGVACEIKESSTEPSSGVFSLNNDSVGTCDVELIDSPIMESIDSLHIASTSSHCAESEKMPIYESVGSFHIESSGSLYMEPSVSSSMKSADSSGIGSSCPSSMESSYPSSMESSGLSSMESSCPSSMESSGPSSMECTNSPSVTKPTMEKLCMLCCSEPVSASIIHGKFAHQISCYKCARRLKREKKGCPVCRRTIDRVVIQVNM